MSWTIPYLAGIYAMSCQIYPNINMKDFLEILNKTSTQTVIKAGDCDWNINVINPVGIVNECLLETGQKPIPEPNYEQQNQEKPVIQIKKPKMGM
jgi:hypothetical protein